MASEITTVSAEEMVPAAGYRLWPEMVPMHGLTLVVGLRPDGQQALHVVYNSDAPPWVLVGLLESVKADLIRCWQMEGYETEDED